MVFRHMGVTPPAPLEVEYRPEGRYYKLPSGLWVPSVTTVLGYFKKDSLTNWENRVGAEEAERIRNRAGNRGTKFHSMVEKYLNNEPMSEVFKGVMPDMQDAFTICRPALDKIDCIEHIEAQLYSKSLKVAGRSDVICTYAGVGSIVDFKTSLRPKKKEWIEHYFEQLAAYRIMYRETIDYIDIDQIVVIISVDHETEPQVFIEDPYKYEAGLKQKIKTYYKEVLNVS